MSITVEVSDFNDEEYSDTLMKTTEHLWNIGSISQGLNPVLSNLYINSMQNIINRFPTITLGNSTKALNMSNCPYCGAFREPNTSRIRCKSRPKLTKQMKKIYKINWLKPSAMLAKQKRKLKNYQRSRNKFVYTCLNCGKRIKLDGNKKPNEPNSNVIVANIEKPKLSRRTKRNMKNKLFQVEEASQLASSPLLPPLKETKLDQIIEKQPILKPNSSKKAKRNSLLQNVLATELEKDSKLRPKNLGDFLNSLK